jgi:hypothetical protein
MMNSKQSAAGWRHPAVAAAAVLALVSLGAVSLTSSQADPPPPSTSASPNGEPLDPIKVQWNQQQAADQQRRDAAWADPEQQAAVKAKKAAGQADAEAASKAHIQQDIRAICAVGALDAAPPLPGEVFISTGAQVQVIHGQCVAVYAGQPGLAASADGAVFVTYLSADGTLASHEWTYPGDGSLKLTKLTGGGIATLVPANGKPFDLDITKY